MESDVTTAESILSDGNDFVTTYKYNSKVSKRYNKDGTLILRAKENIFKPSYKCQRALKKKLKKYKLRKDGKEDPEVLDISQFLSASLKIKSPNGTNNNNKYIDDYAESNYTNYLVKMAKPSTQNKINKKDGKTDEDKNRKIQKHSETKEKNAKFVLKHNKTHTINSEDFVSPKSTQNKAKEMNAFQLMMNARNKSIGSNSPGKEKSVELTENELEIKQRKVKRILALEKMAEVKGALKNKSLELLKDERIKAKMDQRAKRLKKMLAKNKSSISCTENETEISGKQFTKDISTTSNKRRKSDTTTEKVTKRLKTEKENVIIDIDDDKIQNSNDKNLEDLGFVGNGLQNGENMHKAHSSAKNPLLCKRMSQSDVEFLSNLSPSIKKKESMLSYFGKVEKNEQKNEECIEILDDEFTENVIKVKFTPKKTSKKLKLKKKKVIRDTGKEEDLKRNEKNNHIEVEKLLNKGVIEHCLENNNQDVLANNETDIINSNFTSDKNVEEKVPKSIKKSRVKKDNEEIIKKCDNSPLDATSNERPKRSTKKPVKYQDSDDDLHIFTPKQNKSCKESPASAQKSIKTISPRNILKSTPQKERDDVKRSVKISKIKQFAKKNESDSKKPTKLAPIFAQKLQLTKDELEAKQRFLHSGIPNQMKKVIERQKSRELEADYFPTVHHVQQKSTSLDEFDPWALTEVGLDLNHEVDPSVILLKQDWDHNLKYEKFPYELKRNNNNVDYKEKLQTIKNNYPKFPVYRTFRLLKDKCRPDKDDSSQALEIDKVNISSDLLNNLCDSKGDDLNILNWTEKFRPTNTNDIIGNFDGIKTLKKWLAMWKENNTQSKIQHHNSESSDSSDFCYSDTDSRDSMKSYNNVLIVTGPVGCGKTSAIYAVATELAIKVIEVNASTKRTGKKIISDLHEATQSHKVNRLHGTNSLENSQNSQDLPGSKNKKKSKCMKTYSKKTMTKQISQSKTVDVLSSSQYNNETARTAMSLILVDDADLVFEQDDGFISALSQIVHSSKRPVIIVTSSVTCPHLQRFISSGNVIKFAALSPKMLGTWLDILCLVENGDIWPNMGQTLLDFCNGDIRKAINTLQFWVGSDNPNLSGTVDYSNSKEPSQESEKVSGPDIEDECSAMSWPEQENPVTAKTTDKNFQNDNMCSTKALFRTLKSFNDHDIGIRNSTLQFPVDHTNIWWNVPSLLKMNKDNDENNETLSNDDQSDKNGLKAISELLDNISASDFLFKKPSLNSCVTSNPWTNKVCDSVSEAVDMSSYTRSRGLGDSISFAMLCSSLRSTQKAFGISEDSLNVDYTLPGMQQRRARDKIINRHRALQDGFTPSSQLDRKGLAMDYWSSCREICRIEKLKSDHNNKRNNRFCHYLKSMKGSLSNDALEKLCYSLSSCDVQCGDVS